MANAGAIAIKNDWREQMQVIRPVINQANTRHLGLLPGYSLEWKGEFGNSAVANAGLASTMPRSWGCVRCHWVF